MIHNNMYILRYGRYIENGQVCGQIIEFLTLIGRNKLKKHNRIVIHKTHTPHIL